MNGNDNATVAFQAPDLNGQLDAAQKGRKGKLQEHGRQVIATLYMLIRNVRMYDAENAIFAQPLEQLRETINTVLAVDGRFDLAAAGTVLTLNGTLIQVDFSSLENVRHLTTELKNRDMGGLTVTRPVQLGELKAFLRAFAWVDVPLDDIEGVVNVKVAKYRAIVEQLDRQSEMEILKNRKIDRKKYALTVYARTVQFMTRYLNAIAVGDRPPPTTAAQRLVRDFIDVCLEQRGSDGARAPLDRNYFLGMSTVRAAHDYLAYHSVNACLMSIMLGVELGLSKDQLLDLGRAALFHDVGVAGSDPSILNKTGALTPEEKSVVAQNPLIAAKVLLQGRPIDLGALKAILAAHEAKQSFFMGERDAQGAIRLKLRGLGVFGRIIHVASVYDALTSARPWRDAFDPNAAIQVMCTQMKAEFDPFLLGVFTKIIAGISLEDAGGSFSVA